MSELETLRKTTKVTDVATSQCTSPSQGARLEFVNVEANHSRGALVEDNGGTKEASQVLVVNTDEGIQGKKTIPPMEGIELA